MACSYMLCVRGGVAPPGDCCAVVRCQPQTISNQGLWLNHDLWAVMGKDRGKDATPENNYWIMPDWHVIGKSMARLVTQAYPFRLALCAILKG